MPQINMEAITQQLFDNDSVRTRICRDYGLVEGLDPKQTATAMVAAFGQDPSTNSGKRGEASNGAVFRAASRALASNSRSWSTFLRFETRLSDLTSQYDPQRTAAEARSGRLAVENLAACLPGLTSAGDAAAKGA